MSVAVAGTAASAAAASLSGMPAKGRPLGVTSRVWFQVCAAATAAAATDAPDTAADDVSLL